MKKSTYKYWGIVAMSLIVNISFAREIVDFKSSKKVEKTTASDCEESSTQTDLDIGNVRATILVGGDMWWDKKSARYEVPKVTNPSEKRFSLFSGSLWIGGIDKNSNQLRIAAQTYRQNGNDFFAGPLDTANGLTDKNTCKDFDRHWKINKADVQNFVTNGVSNNIIQSWPGNGKGNQSKFLAPFYDANANGTYEPDQGDYPYFNLSNTPTCKKDILKGDQCIWWVFNDTGNSHTESGGQSIGLEIQAQAFAFTTSSDNPIRNCTFYQYKIINRGHSTMDSTYFGQWVDADLGYAFDDYVGCDVNRGFGYCYNGDQNDEGPTGYGLNPPAIGVDFFEGPSADIGDGKDNDRDGCVDCTFGVDAQGNKIVVPEDSLHRELIIMSKFVYYNNDFSITGNPQSAQHYYNYLNGVWKDGQRFTYGGNGKGQGNGGTSGKPNWCNYMFPGDSDPNQYGEISSPKPAQRPLWTEVTAGNQPADRRFIQSAGPFTLKPGGINFITTGVVWARASTGGPEASVAALRAIDDDAQALFKSCFNITNGPDAPTVSIRELDKEIIISLSNDSTSNNFREKYTEIDPYTSKSTFYEFQGYQIFQLRKESAGTSLYNSSNKLDEDNVKLVAQCDIIDNIFKPVSYIRDGSNNSWIPVSYISEGAVVPYNTVNTGVKHTFRITQDLFANDLKIVNNKKLYYMIVAYGVNKSTEEITTDPYNPANPTSHYKPYISSRRGPGGSGSVPVYQVIAHIPTAENGGTIINSQYGGALPVTRITGQGNGGNKLDFSENSLSKIVDGNRDSLEYLPGRGPIQVNVFDAVKLAKADFKLTFVGNAITDSTKWTLTNSLNSDTYISEQSISSASEDIIKSKWGFSVTIKKVVPPSVDMFNNSNGALGSSVTFLPDTSNIWFKNVADFDSIRTKAYPGIPQSIFGNTVADWISNVGSGDPNVTAYDTLGYFNKIAADYTFNNITNLTPKHGSGGTWAPFIFTKGDSISPNYSKVILNSTITKNNILNLPSVLLVITPDKAKWTRSAVIEEQVNLLNSEGKQSKLGLRKHNSVDKNGQPDGDGQGLGWFPGYAVNLETGERLNIMFGEDSYYSDNGQDLLWNPSDVAIPKDSAAQVPTFGAERFFGGKHYIYVMEHNSATGVPAYDSCSFIRKQLLINTLTSKAKVYGDAGWCGMPILAPGKKMQDGIPLSEVRIKLFVSKPYGNTRYVGDAPVANPSYTFSTKNIAVEKNNLSVAQKALDLIKVVPNPYYAYDEYEASQFDNKIKLTNLPSVCTISIYTVNGTLVRTITKDTKSNPFNNGDSSEGIVSDNRNKSNDNSVEWDLKNSYGIPIASGAYIFHIKADGIGEKVVKWFGVLRPLDLSNY